MGNLDSLNYDPVFRTSSLDFSNMNGFGLNENINSQFYIRNGTKLECKLKDSNGVVDNFSNNSDENFTINFTSNYNSGEYNLTCTVKDNENETREINFPIGFDEISILGSQIDNNSSLKYFNNFIRDINKKLCISYDSVTSELDNNVSVKPFYSINNGDENLSEFNSTKGYCLDISNLGDNNLTIGILARNKYGLEKRIYLVTPEKNHLCLDDLI